MTNLSIVHITHNYFVKVVFEFFAIPATSLCGYNYAPQYECVKIEALFNFYIGQLFLFVLLPSKRFKHWVVNVGGWRLTSSRDRTWWLRLMLSIGNQDRYDPARCTWDALSMNCTSIMRHSHTQDKEQAEELYLSSKRTVGGLLSTWDHRYLTP